MTTVLVADSNLAFAAFMAEELHRQGGYRVLLAASGPEAVRRCAEAKPDLVVIDTDLSDSRLETLVDQLRQRVPNLPLVLTPWNESDLPPGLSVQGVLRKPVFLPDLLELIPKLLGPVKPPALAQSAPLQKPKSRPLLGQTGLLNLRSRIAGRTGPLTQAKVEAPKPDSAPLKLSQPTGLLTDRNRRIVEAHLEVMSHALRDEPVLLTQAEQVIYVMPRLSPTAAAALNRVIVRAWSVNGIAPEVIRFEGDTEINRYMLYSVRVTPHTYTLSVALRVRIPLTIVRRIAHDTAAEIAKVISA